MLRNYLKIALRVLARRPFFTFVSLFGISLTLVVLIAVSSVLDGLLAPATPETELNRTLCINRVEMRGTRMVTSGAAGYGLLDRSARDLPGVERVSFYCEPRDVVSYLAGRKILSTLRHTDAEYWRILRFNFLEGGPFTEQHEAGAEPVVVISASSRRTFFGERATALGQTIEADGQRYRVVGVVQDVSRSRLSAGADMWTTLAMIKGDSWRSQFRGPFEALLLAQDAGRFAQIRAEFRARLARLALPDPENFDTINSAAETRLEQVIREMTSSPLGGVPVAATLLGLVGLGLAFMMLPAVNLVNLNVSRIIERSSEIGVRKAFGASGRQLVVQFLLENMLLALLGGLIGIGLTIPLLSLWNRLELVGGMTLIMNPRIALYGLGLATLFGLISGLYPALRMSRLDVVAALKGDSR